MEGAATNKLVLELLPFLKDNVQSILATLAN